MSTTAFLVLVTTSGVSVAMQVVMYRYCDRDPPPRAIFPLCAVTYLMCCTAFALGVGQRLGPIAPMAFVPQAVFILTPPLAFGGQLIAHAFAEMAQASIFESSMVTPAPQSYGRARMCAVQGDIDGAVAAYLKYHAEAPKLATPLFAAATLLTQHKRHDDVGAMYRRIMRVYEQNKFIWAEAALRLATYQYEVTKQEAEADRLLHEIMRKAPRSRQAHAAGNRVLRKQMAAPVRQPVE